MSNDKLMHVLSKDNFINRWVGALHQSSVYVVKRILGCIIYRYWRNLPHRLLFYFIKIYADLRGFNVAFLKQCINVEKDSKRLIVPYSSLYYFIDVLDHFDIHFDSVVPDYEGGFAIVDYSKIKLQRLKNGLELFFSSFVEDEHILEGYFSGYTPKTGDVVIDYGAYCGLVTYYLSKLVGETGKVYSVEPDPINFSALMKNIRLHRLGNVTPIRAGISSETKIVKPDTALIFGDFSNQWVRYQSKLKRIMHALYHVHPLIYSHFGSIEKNRVEFYSFEDFIKKFNIQKLDFVKMDIEGAEVEIIEAAKDFIKGRNINFAIAAYHRTNTVEKLIKSFEHAGYESSVHFPRHLTLCARKKSSL